MNMMESPHGKGPDAREQLRKETVNLFNTAKQHVAELEHQKAETTDAQQIRLLESQIVVEKRKMEGYRQDMDELGYLV